MPTITVWNEYIHEKENDRAAELYPDGVHTHIANILAEAGHDTRTATLQEPDHGLTEEVLEDTDVLYWWGHIAHDEVDDQIAERVARHVREGMGLVVLHSGHHAKPFRKLLGMDADLTWRAIGERERLHVVDPGHPIASGLPESFVVPEAEMYGEPFTVPEPDRLVFVSWFEGGEVFRSGCCYRRGKGRVFYFRPGHETYPVYHQSEVQTVLRNAAEWAAPVEGSPYPTEPRNVPDPAEDIDGYEPR
ncbi:ThuA domain-containing protein [Halapricum desulfuricans]|uniref:Trehalose utilization protein n=1 Tax=Halapricum desulfuricans TaxID=2841257 RepID=A0A897N3X2_9EURY|nr:ThuA domain-containing protein [Halapricum desulfuricans]QSG05495.1 Trehalose utilization protein [Halapricum desulfuricans]